MIPASQVDAIRTALREHSVDGEVVVYAGADHGFFCDERDSYDAEAAADSWRQLTEFFARHLQAS